MLKTILLILTLGLSVLSLLLHGHHPEPKIQVVDGQRLIAITAQRLTAQGPVSPEQLTQAVNRLHAHVTQWAHNHRVVLITKGAVWSGPVVDATDALLASLEATKESQTTP